MLKVPASPRERGARIGERLETLILGCLAKNPSERPDAAPPPRRAAPGWCGRGDRSTGQAGDQSQRRRPPRCGRDLAPGRGGRGFRCRGLQTKAGRSEPFFGPTREYDEPPDAHLQGRLSAEDDAGRSRGRPPLATNRCWRLGAVGPGGAGRRTRVQDATSRPRAADRRSPKKDRGREPVRRSRIPRAAQGPRKVPSKRIRHQPRRSRRLRDSCSTCTIRSLSTG